eukprot:5208222-Pleurochrysis_carterae.AAC.4
MFEDEIEPPAVTHARILLPFRACMHLYVPFRAHANACTQTRARHIALGSVQHHISKYACAGGKGGGRCASTSSARERVRHACASLHIVCAHACASEAWPKCA